MQVKAQDEYLKRLIYDDAHNLVSDQVKAEYEMSYFADNKSNQASEAAVGVGLARNSVNGLKARKPRPRDVIKSLQNRVKKQ